MVDLVQLCEDLLLYRLQEVLTEHRVGGGGLRGVGLPGRTAATATDPIYYSLSFLRILF